MQNIILFYDDQFPVDGSRPDSAFLSNLGGNVTIVNAHDLAESLNNNNVTSFINLHGPYFPKEAWPAIYNYLHKGNGLVHLGGAPFRVPCYFENGEWLTEREQASYHRQLNIHEAINVSAKPVNNLEHNYDIPLFRGHEGLFSIQDTYHFVLHVTKNVSIPEEMGSVGPMDAVIHPLLKGMSKNDRSVAAPAVLIDNMKGKFTGGRWIFINQLIDTAFWTDQGAGLLLDLAHYTSLRVTEMYLKTNYATYDVGERPRLSFQVQALKNEPVEWTLKYSIIKDNNECFTKTETITANHIMQTTSHTLPFDVDPGLYHVICHAESAHGEKRVLRQGFWGRDDALLQTGDPIAVDRDYFQKDGRPLPIVGMTYMTSDVARYFLFLPNADVWDRDMAHMKRAGINYIRTGIWTAWRHMMFADGHFDEGVLRAIDAFILTAKKHDLEVTFNFFSFTPEMWEGQNPYLDPRSVEAQKRFITAVVSRHTTTTNVHWDLINEPSLFNPEQTFAGPRTLKDPYDRKAFRKWLKQRHGSIRSLQEKWHMTELELPSFDAIEPPEASDINFGIRDMLFGKNGLKWIDYTLYTMDMHNRWVEELSEPIKQLAQKQLITVGQDEALAGLRPSPLFYDKAVDYTTNHTWWLLDQLVWDGIFTKSPYKPNLIQETGIMYVEQPHNFAKRSEEELRNILERKYAYAFSTGGAGAVQWLWNINYYMHNINESNIGAIRADGTEKPETNVSYDFGSFMNDTRDFFKNRQLEDVAVVFPFSNDFSNRRLAVDATSKLTRILAYDMNVPFRAISEYDLTPIEADPPKLIIVPSPHHFNSEALTQLMDFVEKLGITILFTGPISLDEYWHTTDRMQHILGETQPENIVREETFSLNKKHYHVSFSNERIADTMKELDYNQDNPDAVKQTTHGKGHIIWCPVPVELNDRNDPIIALYQHALNKAGVAETMTWLQGDIPGIYGQKLTFDQGRLFIFVSEFSADQTVKFTDPMTHKTYEFLLEKERTVMFMADQEGDLVKTYRPDEVTINVKN